MDATPLLAAVVAVPDREVKAAAGVNGAGKPADATALGRPAAFAGVLLQRQNRAQGGEPDLQPGAAGPQQDARPATKGMEVAAFWISPAVTVGSDDAAADPTAAAQAPEALPAPAVADPAAPTIAAGVVLMPDQAGADATVADAALADATVVPGLPGGTDAPAAMEAPSAIAAPAHPAGLAVSTPGPDAVPAGGSLPTVEAPVVPPVAAPAPSGAPAPAAANGDPDAPVSLAQGQVDSRAGQAPPAAAAVAAVLPPAAAQAVSPGANRPTTAGAAGNVTATPAVVEGTDRAMSRPASAQLPLHAARLWTAVAESDSVKTPAAAFRPSVSATVKSAVAEASGTVPRSIPASSASPAPGIEAAGPQPTVVPVLRAAVAAAAPGQDGPDTTAGAGAHDPVVSAHGASATAAPGPQPDFVATEPAGEASAAPADAERSTGTQDPAGETASASAGLERAVARAGLHRRLEFLAQTLAAGGDALALVADGALAADGGLATGRVLATGASTAQAPTPARATVIQQIAAGLRESPAGESLTLQLNPAELGEVEIRFLGKGDSLQIQITAGSREAETAIRENLQELKDALGDKAARFQQVEVKVELKESQDHRQERRDGERREQAKDQGRPDEQQNRRGSGSRSRQTGQQSPAAQWAKVFREVQ